MKKNAFATSLVAAALALGVTATPAIALAQTAPESTAASKSASTLPYVLPRPLDPSYPIGQAKAAPQATAIVAQSADDDLTDSFLIAITDAGYSVSEVALTGADTYVNAYGEYVDYIGFNAYGTHFDYEVDHYTGAVCHWTMYAL